jgi:hypothetical protein
MTIFDEAFQMAENEARREFALNKEFALPEMTEDEIEAALADDAPVPEDVRMVSPLSDARLDEIEHNWHNMPGDARMRVVNALLADVRASHANEAHLRRVITTLHAECGRHVHRIAALEKDIEMLRKTAGPLASEAAKRLRTLGAS